jgi:hypothetical protein
LHTPWESKKINAARRHIFPNGAGSHTEAARAQTGFLTLEYIQQRDK